MESYIQRNILVVESRKHTNKHFFPLNATGLNNPPKILHNLKLCNLINVNKKKYNLASAETD